MSMALRTFIPLILMALLLIGSAFNFYIKYSESEERIRQDAVERIVNIGNLISANIETGIRYGLPSIVRSAIEQSQSTKSIVYSLLVNDENQIFSANKRALEGKPFDMLDETLSTNYFSKLDRNYHVDYLDDTSKWLVYQFPLSRQSEDNLLAGQADRLILVSDISSELEQLNSFLIQEMIIWSLLSLVIVGSIWLLLKYIVVLPVEELKANAESIVDGELKKIRQHYLLSEFESLDSSLRSSAEKIHTLERSYQELYEKNPATFLTIDDEFKIVNINDYGLKTFGYDKSELIGQDARILYAESDQPLFEQYLESIKQTNLSTKHWELKRVSKSGYGFWTRDGARAIDQFGKRFILIVSQDISDLHKMSQKLSYQASHDDLTGLINRLEFSRLLDMSIEKSVVQQTRHCVCFLDLDQFKVINDICGHSAGDILLKQISTLFKQCLRKDDVLARIGGDEFALLLECCEPDKAIEIIQTMRVALERHRFSWENKFFEVGISAGISVIDQDTRSIQNVLSEADSACYVAKEKGRNKTIVFNESSEESTSLLGEMKWVDKINQSLRDPGGFELYFQKIKPLSSKNQNLFKGEVLIRMIRKGQVIPPGAFLPAAERYNLAYKIDYWVVETTIKTIKSFLSVLPEQWKISINLSAQTISSARYNNKIFKLLSDVPELCPNLCFEVTETAAMANFSTAIEFMLRLNKLGCHFSLDDFGSGFSSFGYLKQMPVDYVKIDGMFVKELSSRPVDQALVQSMNNIAHALEKSTIAEFVENQQSEDYLTSIGVDFGQGYHFHKPEPLKDLLAAANYEFPEPTLEVVRKGL